MGKTHGKKIGQLAERKPPKHLTADQKAIYAEIMPILDEMTPPHIVETIAATLGIIHDARAILGAETVTIVNSKGELAAHPALETVATATKTFDLLIYN